MGIPKEGSRDTGKGILISKYPDYCRSPNAIIPYTIVAHQLDDANTCTTVRQTKQRSHNMGSIITCCAGDEPGIGLGVKSNTIKSVCHPLEHSKTVRFEGKCAIRHRDVCHMNNRNTTGKLYFVENTDIVKATPPFEAYQVAEAALKQTMTDESPRSAGPTRGGAAQTAPATSPGQTTPKTAPVPANDNAKYWSQAKPPGQLKGQPFLSRSPMGSIMGRMGAMGSTGDAAAAFQMMTSGTQKFLDRAPGEIPYINKELGVGIDPNNPAEVVAAAGFLEDIDATTQPWGGTNLYTEDQAIARLKERLEESRRIQASEAPAVGITSENNRTTDDEKRKERPCDVRPYASLQGTCPKGQQAHHIVPDYTLRYGTRAESMMDKPFGLKRIGDGGGGTLLRQTARYPSYWEGPAICLVGNAKDNGTEHWEAHGADKVIADLGSNPTGGNPVGTATIGEVKNEATKQTVSARPECAPEIRSAVAAAFPAEYNGRLARTTQSLPTGDAHSWLVGGMTMTRQ